MESAELQVTSIESTDGITLENETGLANNVESYIFGGQLKNTI